MKLRSLAVLAGAAGAIALGACRGVLGIQALGLDAGSDVTVTAPSDGPDGSDGSDQTDAGGGVDASDAEASAVGRCDPTKPFGALRPVPVTLPPYVAPRGGRLSPDELHFYFSALRSGGGSNIFEAVRGSRLEPFQSANAIAALNTDPTGDDRPSFSGDLLSVVFDSNRGGTVPNLYFANRGSPTSGAFSAPVPLAALNANIERDAYVIGDGRAIYWTSERDLMPARVFRGSGATPFEYTAIGALDVVNLLDGAGTFNQAPVLTPDERVIYFSHGPNTPAGNHQIYRAVRAQPTDTFGAPQAVPELAHPAADYPTWVSPDDCILYFFSLREPPPELDAGSGPLIWVAERPAP